MFERFTENARQVVVLAQEEARLLSHNYIGTEHILLGLLAAPQSRSAEVLASLGVTLERARAHVERIVGRGDDASSDQIPFTPRAKQVLELALREALSLGHDHIGTEHILLGLVREGEGVAARVLLDFDADTLKVRNAVIRALDGPGAQGASSLAIESRGALDPAWLGGLDGVLRELQSALRIQLGRRPDSADLLLALAAADTRAAATLREAGVDLEALTAAAHAVRAAAEPTQAELADQLVQLRQARERAAREQDYETAASLRDRERELARGQRDDRLSDELLVAIRTGLGLPADER